MVKSVLNLSESIPSHKTKRFPELPCSLVMLKYAHWTLCLRKCYSDVLWEEGMLGDLKEAGSMNTRTWVYSTGEENITRDTKWNLV
jgi:hypothetical protein